MDIEAKNVFEKSTRLAISKFLASHLLNILAILCKTLLRTSEDIISSNHYFELFICYLE